MVQFIHFAGQIIATATICRIYLECDTVIIELKNGAQIEKEYWFRDLARQKLKCLKAILCQED